MKLLVLLILIIPLTACHEKPGTQDQKAYPAQSGKNAQPAGKEKIITFDPVITAQDALIPLLNTNVFIKTNDEALAEKIHQDLVTYHKLTDQYHYYAEGSAIAKNVKIVNDHIAQNHTIILDEKLFTLLEHSFDLMDLTHGYFNIFINPVLELYGGKFSPFPMEHTDPEAEDIEKALKKVMTYEQAYENFLFDKDTYTLSFASPSEASFNLGAISKGFIAEEISKKYTEGVYLLSLGSSTIYSQGRDYKIGVLSPYNNRGALFHINLPSGMSLSTSSTANNYYILKDDGETVRSHLLNPYTGYSSDYYWSVTIISGNAMAADALTTALFNVKDTDEVMEIINAARKKYGCVLEACFVKELSRRRKEAGLLMTEGFQAYINSEYTDPSVADKKIIGK